MQIIKKIGLVQVGGTPRFEKQLNFFFKSANYTQGKIKSIAIICDSDDSPQKITKSIHCALKAANEPTPNGWTVRPDRLRKLSRKNQKKTQTAKQGSDTPTAAVIPVAQPAIDNTPVKQSLSMLSESVDWSQVAACVSSKSNCICYGHSAQRLNIVPDTCNAAINYGWLVSKKM